MLDFTKLSDAFIPGTPIIVTFRQPSALVSVSGIFHDKSTEGILIETETNGYGHIPATRYLLFCQWLAIQSIIFVPSSKPA
ncbi:MAG TPA: hypothetical protein VH540_22130 [Ktedonobacterales bacterium]|jgi:hypothetical protein